MSEGDSSVFGVVEEQCTCWVCFEVFERPVTLQCGHTFCLDCAEKVHKKNPSCPFCRKPFDLPLPEINKEIEALVAGFLEGQARDESMVEAATVQQDSLLFELPEEVILEILGYLPPKQIGRASKVCRDLHRLADDGWLWRSLCQASFPFCSVDKYGKNWKWCYIGRSNIHKGWQEGKAGDFTVTTLRGHQNYISSFALYRNNIVSASADCNVKVWKADHAAPLNTLVGHTALVKCIQFNEVKIASGSADRSVKLWDTRTGLPIRKMDHSGEVNCLQFDDNKVISGSGDCKVRVWDPQDGTATMTLNGHSHAVESMQFDNNHVISCGADGARVWDLRNGNQIHHLASVKRFHQLGGNKVATVDHYGALHKWDISTGSTSPFSGAQHSGNIYELQSDVKSIVTAGQDGKVKVWDLGHQKLVHTLDEHKQAVHTVQMQGNKIVSGSADNSLKVWDRQKGSKVYTLLGGSLQQRSNNPQHPTKPGCSHLEIDDSRIVASFASLVRVYDFEIYKGPQ